MVDAQVAMENMSEADEAFETYYVTDNLESNTYNSKLIEIPDFDSEGTRVINLHVVEESPFYTFEESGIGLSEGELDEAGTKMVGYSANEAKLALGLHLSHLEIHGFDEEESWRTLRKNLEEELVDGVRAELEEISRKERARKMMTQVEEKLSLVPTPIWKKPIEDGKWRDTDLDADGAGLARDILSRITVDPRTCYLTAQRAYREADDYDRVDYCEGLAFPKQTGRVVRHAWIEIDGSVAELTWPWHQVDGREALYYGMKVPYDVFYERLERREDASMLMLDDEERDQLHEMPNQMAQKVGADR
ncbi:hypothetical protein [Haloplanus sp. C73]|uniref:hypothetical protein n=1 Tax=Haloplanus sp. C73 TaxID=3421641 RepID=UPI003EB7A9AB